MSNSAYDLDCDGYRVLKMIQGSIGRPKIKLGVYGQCRFCGENKSRGFRNVAHVLPEAFGNKWITSNDECDACNARFSSFDDALAKSMGALLTVGGVQGKGNKVRQTGRSVGPSSIRHGQIDGLRSISMRANGADLNDHVRFNQATGEIVLRMSGGTERFVPARAYKALVKMAVEILPVDELHEFSHIIAWLNTPDENLLPFMIVGVSFANLGNGAPIVSATLLRRIINHRDMPHTIFVTSMGAVCLQIVLKPNIHDGEWPSLLRTRPSIHWKNVIGPPEQDQVVMTYQGLAHLDWGRSELELPIVETIETRVHVPTQRAWMKPILRASALADNQVA